MRKVRRRGLGLSQGTHENHNYRTPPPKKTCVSCFIHRFVSRSPDKKTPIGGPMLETPRVEVFDLKNADTCVVKNFLIARPR